MPLAHINLRNIKCANRLTILYLVKIWKNKCIVYDSHDTCNYHYHHHSRLIRVGILYFTFRLLSKVRNGMNACPRSFVLHAQSIHNTCFSNSQEEWIAHT